MEDIKVFLNKKKKKKRQYGRKRYKNLSEAKKQKLVEHRKKIYNTIKNDLKKLFFQEIRLNLFTSRLSLESSPGTLTQRSSSVMRIFFFYA